MVIKSYLPFGKHTENYGKSQFLDGKINYFYGNVQKQTVSLPDLWPFSIANC